MINLDSIFKSRDITLPTKVKPMVFPVVMYGCESWTVKKAEHRSIHAFELWCWRRLLRVPWTARRSNQSLLKISPGISLEEMMLKLKLQYFGHLMWKVNSLGRLWYWEGLGAGGEGDDRGWDGWMASATQWTWVWVNSGFWWWTVRPHVLRFMGLQWVGTTEQMNWTELNWRTYHVLGIILKSFHIKCHFYFYEHHVLGISTPRFYRCVKWDSENLIDFPRFLQWQRNLNATQFESVQPPCLCICHILPSINVSFVNYFKYSKSAASAVLMEVLLFILYYQTKKEVFQVSFCHSKIFQVGKKKMYCLRASCYEPARANYTYLFPGPCLVASG